MTNKPSSTVLSSHESKNIGSGYTRDRNGGTLTTLSFKRSVLRSEESLSIMNARLLHGETPSGKQWSRWDTTDIFTLTTKPRGGGPRRANLYQAFKVANKPGLSWERRTNSAHAWASMAGQKIDTTPGPSPLVLLNYASADTLMVSQMLDLLSTNLPEQDWSYSNDEPISEGFMRNIFPGIKAMGFDRLGEVPYGLSTAMRQETLSAVVTDLFGVRRYRKDLVKATADTSLQALQIANAVKTFVPVDWLVDYMRDNTVDRFHTLNGPIPVIVIKTIFPHIPVNRRRRFLLSMRSAATRILLTDLGRYLAGNTLPDEDIAAARTLQELHDTAVANYNRARPVYNYQAAFSPTKIDLTLPIPETEISTALSGLATDSGFMLHSASTGEDLQAWGKEMHNCIGSYSHSAYDSSSILGAIRKNDVLVGNFEVAKNGSVKQLLAKYNGQFSVKDQKEILSAMLKTEKVSIPSDNYIWGIDSAVITEIKEK